MSLTVVDDEKSCKQHHCLLNQDTEIQIWLTYHQFKWDRNKPRFQCGGRNRRRWGWRKAAKTAIERGE